MGIFKLHSDYLPRGDQPEAIAALTEGLRQNKRYQVLLGVTGSGKTFTIANVIAQFDRPVLVLSHNKTLAAQLYGEFKQLFPENAVEYFISYYDYYQPEAYIPGKDIYIEKDADINEQIDKLRLRATMSLMERRDVIIVASVSCIYGLGVPEDYREALIHLKTGMQMERDELLEKLISAHYSRNDIAFERGTFRVRGDIVDIFPAYQEHFIRVEFFGDEIVRIEKFHPITYQSLEEVPEYSVYPAIHFLTNPDRLKRAIASIESELDERVAYFLSQQKYLEAERLQTRTKFDLEMLAELGYCSGIENYSRHLTGAKPGEPPKCLLDYFPDDFIMVIDESHVTIPQIQGMYAGDYTRKKNLVEYGFRLPSAFDNRPLRFDEFQKYMHNVIFVSATPADYELSLTNGEVVEQVIRPTGLLDPEIEIKPIKNQVDDLINQIRERVAKNQKVLVMTLTKRMSEDLSQYLQKAGIKSKYLHSEIDSIERAQIIRSLRLGEFDVIVGVNLLREGLDLPEVSLVAILDADKTGFLRSARSLIQISGRAARNVDGKVVLYADEITDAIKKTLEETNRRRAKQLAYNQEHGITPQSISKTLQQIMESTAIAEGYDAMEKKAKANHFRKEDFYDYLELDNKEKLLQILKKEMKQAAAKLDFERAAELRDTIAELEKQANS
ncbi:MAG TPA: excinuclease ABC subunit UvrB [Candidatus Syntrophosphaera thermopropionivorans]|nr:excinuclease ABC subunit UvrB [Candidatus Syntrophosphaera sp.]HOJ41402.1 excinuclease ABC subunit UvrB [Candidatus Syntrophosphaera thermopropionivorans]HOL33224.1 excinuclease ABC subunit UvrB [Candidatus Syntrophosphaera thermopropionivorans]HPQ30888.1 excinuclease ABC subunit UvrB [Candidatus Syntrophosphaera thermopropionivorans]HPX63547.1 excinuclease ABC subunit UvrB [Candidatus Syntrophosphaera thermopropionivorans]